MVLYHVVGVDLSSRLWSVFVVRLCRLRSSSWVVFIVVIVVTGRKLLLIVDSCCLLRFV